MKKHLLLWISLFTLIILACGLPAPASISARVRILTPAVATATAINVPTEQVGIVVADKLTVRTGPGETYPVYKIGGHEVYLLKGQAVLIDGCRNMDGNIWAEYTDKFFAVYYRGTIYVDGICQRLIQN